MVCPLCGSRKARRGCPAVGQQICPVCCGTKRLVQINCPRDCTWLASAREHPPAVVVRQHQRDVGLLVQFMRDLTERQTQIFFLVNTFFASYQAEELHAVRDEDVAEASDALASTYETAARGVIYDHRPASLPAERLVVALKPLLVEAGKNIGSAFDRDASFVLRRVAESTRELHAHDPGNRRVYLDLIERVIVRRDPGKADAPDAEPQPSRLIVP